MSIFSPIRSIVTRYGARRRRYVTERIVRGLPSDVQKDIGWPDIADGLARADDRLRANGSWHG
ncbi:MAG: hypothetical protein JJ864_15400 [Rhizobiaceae bacterium]|nr:hypothetical protein [Rhizobiaceae bacterium]